jgi:hypothetical protein
VRKPQFSAENEIMNHAFAKPMIRQSGSRHGRFRFPATLVLLLLLSGAACAGETPTKPPTDPDWCGCPAIVASEAEETRERLIAESRKRQAECRESLGVDMEQQRKGQGARLDACRCSCLEDDAAPGEGPWGDRRKPARSGR